MQHGPETPSQPAPMGNDSSTDSTNESALNADSTVQSVDSGEGQSFFEGMRPGEGSLVPGMLMMAAVVLTLIVIMRSVSRSSSRRKQTTRTMGDPSARIAKLNAGAQSSMEPARQAMVKAEEVTRRLGAVLDNKATKIEILLEEATERIKQLEEAAARQPVETPQAAPEKRVITPEALDQARLDQDRAERDTAEQPDAVLKFEATNSPTAAELPIQDQVTQLAEGGMDAMSIANKLNRPVGEIELILNLWRNSG